MKDKERLGNCHGLEVTEINVNINATWCPGLDPGTEKELGKVWNFLGIGTVFLLPRLSIKLSTVTSWCAQVRHKDNNYSCYLWHT